VNVNGRDRVLNPGPLSRRPDKSTTTPRSDTSSYFLFPCLGYCDTSQIDFLLVP
jgi:hypothetical protein